MSAQEATPPTRELELGALYKVEGGVGPARFEHEGRLCLASDEWLVLETIRAGRTERAVPISRLPIANRFFKNVGIGRSTTRQWIPRGAAATVQQVARPDESGPDAERPRQPPELKAGERAVVTWLSASQLEASVGHLVTIDTHGLLLEQNVREAQVEAVPGLGSLPLVGSLFRRSVVSHKRVEQQIALSQVLSIEVADNFIERPLPEPAAP